VLVGGGIFDLTVADGTGPRNGKIGLVVVRVADNDNTIAAISANFSTSATSSAAKTICTRYRSSASVPSCAAPP
jgi:hypothetical protein